MPSTSRRSSATACASSARARASARFAITGDADDLRGKDFDAILFLIKSKATAAVLAQLRPVLSGNPILVTLQNGMGNAEVLLDVPGAIVARGATMNAGRYVEPGVVENLIEGKTWLGPERGRVEDIAALGAVAERQPACRPRSSPIRWARCGRNSSSTA